MSDTYVTYSPVDVKATLSLYNLLWWWGLIEELTKPQLLMLPAPMGGDLN